MKTSFLYKEGGQLHEMPSMCMYCHAEGTTKLLLTSIPLFKEVMISSFECPECHYKENDIRSASGIADTASKYVLTVDVLEQDDEEIHRNLNRQVLRSETAVIRIPEIDFEIEARRSEIITVEGLLRNIRESLTAGQPERKDRQPEAFEKLEEIIERIQMFEEGRDSFTLIVDDKGGNSFIENPLAPAADRHCKLTRRYRTADENVALGYTPQDGIVADTADEATRPLTEEEKKEVVKRAMEDIAVRQEGINRSIAMEKLSSIPHRDAAEMYSSEGRGETYKSGGSKAALKIMSSTMLNKKPLDRFEAIRENSELQAAVFHDRCHECGRTNETRMLLFEIPYFNTIIIMCTDCSYCGFKNSEIKPGSGYAPQGVKITVKINSVDDLSRDVLKSDHAGITIPEIDMELEYGTLGGKFTTIEGILSEISAQLKSSGAMYEGDSADDVTRENYRKFLQSLDDMMEVKKPFTFVIDDPSGSSFVEGRVNGEHDTNPYEDKNMTIEQYERTFEQNDLLGIAHMVTEGYAEEIAIQSNLEKAKDAQKDAAEAEAQKKDEESVEKTE